jgi:glutamine amidotransferase
MTSASIGIVNYGVGNLGSMLNMLRHLGLEDAREVSDPDDISGVDRLILPGVGSFDRAMAGLAANGLGEAIQAFSASGSPLLGVCLGMQLLARRSAEGISEGLGIMAADCTRLTPVSDDERIPHMGWDWINPVRGHALIDDLPSPAKFYFAHSYAVRCDNDPDVVATTDFAGGFVSVLARGNVAGAQFHPEKSHRFGMGLLLSFSGWKP